MKTNRDAENHLKVLCDKYRRVKGEADRLRGYFEVAVGDERKHYAQRLQDQLSRVKRVSREIAEVSRRV